MNLSLSINAYISQDMRQRLGCQSNNITGFAFKTNFVIFVLQHLTKPEVIQWNVRTTLRT